MFGDRGRLAACIVVWGWQDLCSLLLAFADFGVVFLGSATEEVRLAARVYVLLRLFFLYFWFAGGDALNRISMKALIAKAAAAAMPIPIAVLRLLLAFAFQSPLTSSNYALVFHELSLLRHFAVFCSRVVISHRWAPSGSGCTRGTARSILWLGRKRIACSLGTHIAAFNLLIILFDLVQEVVGPYVLVAISAPGIDVATLILRLLLARSPFGERPS